MLALTNTEHLTGVRISGDYWDFKELKQSFEKLLLTFPPAKDGLNSVRSRIIDLCLQIQSTLDGNFNIETTPNGISKELLKEFKQPFPYDNIYYSTEILWPEILFIFIASNLLINTSSPNENAQTLQLHIMVIRKFQSSIFKCMLMIVGNDERQNIQQYYLYPRLNLYDYSLQYIDMLNVYYLSLSRTERKIHLPRILEKISQEKIDYLDFKQHIDQLSMQSQDSEQNTLLAFDYPQRIIW